MTPAPPSRDVAPSYQRSARFLGALASVVLLALAALAALAINDLAQRHVTLGVSLLLAVLALRWALSSALDEWGSTTAERLRARWRGALVAHLATPRRSGEGSRGDLALAIEHASFAPSLERLAASAATALLGVVVIFVAAGWLPLVITVALVALAAPLYQRAGRRSQARSREYQARRALLEVRQLEVLQHAPELRALGAVEFGASEISALSDSEHVLALRAIRVALESSLVTEFLSGVSIGLVAMVVGFGLLGGRVSLVRALVAVLVTSELFVQVRRFGVEFHRRNDAEAARSLLRDLTATPAFTGDGELLRASDLVTDANVVPVNFVVRRGERVVVTGPSGSGKTTLLQTLVGWRRARSGDARRTSAPIGFVGTESTLVSGTLRENLTLGATRHDDDLFARLDSLGLRGARFNDLDAELIEDGRGLSTGERVRVLLARALLADAAVVVLDDVAGVLDESSRDLVRLVLSELADVAVVEATVDTPLLLEANQRLELGT